ncbi:hypothetical protein EK21DRAFT_79878 [Setomelanomma holmii]|uniref:Uncharacterized protein n=1 Tax=Setomelanomma holmii TaxID=210430 RepID=A0A9P4GWB5_9PLEO|nr:hypothetical protein EK21DRAFT_79878 [Setomelanomma holmii]
MAIARLHAILACLACNEVENAPYSDEKLALLTAEEPRKTVQIANDITQTLLTTRLNGPALHMQLDAIVGTYGWKENVANWVLEKLSRALEESHEKLGPTIRAAYRKAIEVAMSIEGFVVEHPVFCTIIALGVLALIVPWVLGALGFGELGLVEGSFAARWMRTYAGFVPKGSLLSYFQRLGMTWKWA